MEKVLVNDMVKLNRKVKRMSKKEMMIRRSIFFSISLVLSIFIIGSVFKLTVEAGNRKVQERISSYEKVEVLVNKGDTIWDLVQEVEPNEDPREMIDLAEEFAGKSLSVIHPGDVITLLRK